jgi:activator of HSP90 ATPase
VEKDCLGWSKQRLQELLCGAVLAEGDSGPSVTAASQLTLTGEAFVNQRKGKLIPSYELELKLEWAGRTAGASSGVQGTVHVPYIADENAGDGDALEVRVAAQADDELSKACKAAVQKQGVAKVRAAVATWVKEMAAGGPGGASAAPQAVAGGDTAAPKAAEKQASGDVKKPSAAAAPPPSAEAHGFATITLTERFYCRPADIFEALTHPGRVRAFTQSDCEVSPQPGAAFHMFGGNIHGENCADMAAPHRISQRWRFRNWPDGVFSNVVIDITEPEHGTTVVQLTQTGVPIADKFGNESVVETTREGWQTNILDRIRKVFGYGA